MFVMAATLGSTLLGFAREVVNARYFGTQWEMDAFLAAAVIPIILFGVFNGALVSALVPTFTEYIAHGKDDEAWRLAIGREQRFAQIMIVVRLRVDDQKDRSDGQC